MRFEKIEAEHPETVEVVWKSFMLCPTPQPRSLDQHREYTRSWLNPAAQPGSGEFNVWATELENEVFAGHTVRGGRGAAYPRRRGRWRIIKERQELRE